MKRSVRNNVQKLREGSADRAGKRRDKAGGTCGEHRRKKRSHENLKTIWSICLVIPPAGTPRSPLAQT